MKTFIESTDVSPIVQMLERFPIDHIYLGSDWHLFKKDVTGLQEKTTNKELDEYVKLHNNKVQDNDVFIYLGDLGHRKCNETHFNKIKDFVNKLNGVKIMIRGNHDLKDDKYYLSCGFDCICDNIELGDVIFTHKPCELKDYPECKLNIHGHMHEEKLYDVEDNNDHIRIYTPDHDVISLKKALNSKKKPNTTSVIDKSKIDDKKELIDKYQKMVDKYMKKNPDIEKLSLEDAYNNQEKICKDFLKKSDIPVTNSFCIHTFMYPTNTKEYESYPKLDKQEKFHRILIYDRDNQIVIDLLPRLQNQRRNVRFHMDDLIKSFWKYDLCHYDNKKYNNDETNDIYKSQVNINESLETTIMTNPFKREMTLYHGSIVGNLTTINPLSKNFGTKLSGFRRSSFWTTSLTMATHRCVYKLLRSLGYDKVVINSDLSFSVIGDYDENEYERFLKKIQNTPFYIYEITISKKYVKCGHDKYFEEYSIDIPVKPDKCHVIPFSKYKTIVSPRMIKFTNTYDSSKLPYSNRDTRLFGNLLFYSDDKKMEMNKKLKSN